MATITAAFRLATALSLTVLLSACAVGTDYKPPEVPTDTAWSALDDEAKEKSPSPLHIKEANETEEFAPWYEKFDDEILSDFVKKAIAENNDLKTAEARILEARAGERVSTSALFPQVSATGSITRKKSGGSFGSSIDTIKEGGFNGAWDVDVFGGTRRGMEAASAGVEAAQADRDRIMLALVAETARTYVGLRALQQQYALTKRNLTAQRQSLEVTQGQRHEGAVSDLEVSRARAQVEATTARLPQIKTAQAAAINRLSVLTGQMPRTLKPMLETIWPIPSMPWKLLIATPLSAIRQRPDVRAAERRLAESTGLSNATFAQAFPSVSLQGFIGRQDSLLYGLANPWTAAGSLLVPLINFGRIGGQIDAADARQQQAFFTYKQTVLLAVEETENALSAYLNEQRRKKNLAAAASAQGNATDIAREQYKVGVATQLDLLLAENNRLEAETQLVLSQASAAANLIQLFTALGEKWQPELPEEKSQ